MLVLNKFIHDSRVEKEARSLTEASHEVVVWALGNNSLPERERKDGYTVKRWRSRTRQWAFRPPGLVYLEYVVQLTRRLLKEKADAYHAHDMNALLPSYLAALVTGAFLIYDSHEFWPAAQGKTRRAGLRIESLKRIEKFLASRAHATITVNDSIAQELQKLYAVHPIVLTNSHEYIEIDKSNLLREELDISESNRIAIFPGVLAANRGLEELIESALYLDRVVVVLMGPDRLNGSLLQKVRHLKVDDKVRFREPVPPAQVGIYTASADIGVIPAQAHRLSYYYSTGNKLYHYLMAGIPVAASNHPEKRKIIETYDVGTVFDETDPRAIAETINQLLSDPQRYQELCANAKRAAREYLNWDIEKQKLIALYESLSQ